MKIQFTAIVVALSFFAAACSTTGDQISLITECKFTDSSKAPPWTCNFDETLDIPQLKNITWAVGRAKKAAAGEAFQKRIATLNGRGQLLNQISVRVENLIQQQVQGSNAQDAAEQFIQSFSEGILAGSRPYSTATDPQSRELYLIVGIKDADFKKNIEGNKQYQELKEAILAGDGGEATAHRIDAGLARISEAKKNVGLEGARKLAQERKKTAP